MSVPLDLALLYDTTPVEDDDSQQPVPLRRETDERLVSFAQRGEYEAFEELVRRYRNDVYALAYHYVKNREEAWDLSQDVFIRAHHGLRRFRGEASFKTWLLRITANRCKDYFKKRRLDTVAFDEAIEATRAADPLTEPGRSLEAEELGRAIDSAVAALPEKHRTAFMLREYEGLSYEQMAEVMKCSMGTVMSRLHHARKKLQRALLAMGVVESE